MKIFDLIKFVAQLEFNTDTGKVNMRQGILVLILTAGLLVPDIVLNVANVILEKFFKIAMPTFPNHVVVIILSITLIYYIVSAVITMKTEEKLKSS
jgi:hypothetical protein